MMSMKSSPFMGWIDFVEDAAAQETVRPRSTSGDPVEGFLEFATHANRVRTTFPRTSGKERTAFFVNVLGRIDDPDLRVAQTIGMIRSSGRVLPSRLWRKEGSAPSGGRTSDHAEACKARPICWAARPIVLPLRT